MTLEEIIDRAQKVVSACPTPMRWDQIAAIVVADAIDTSTAVLADRLERIERSLDVFAAELAARR